MGVNANHVVVGAAPLQLINYVSGQLSMVDHPFQQEMWALAAPVTLYPISCKTEQ